jgi:renalase
VFDVAIIGAGLAGLTCAQQLHQAGYSVIVVEKSRGVGGRVATRRLHHTCADHGVRYLEAQGKRSKQLISRLETRSILQVWTDTIYNLKTNSELGSLDSGSNIPRYVAPEGMTAIAKYLAVGLEIWLNRRMQSLTPTDNSTWNLTLEPQLESQNELQVKAVVMAIPAPQALMLLEPLAPNFLTAGFLDNLRSVEFDPCLSVMAGYPAQRQEELEHLNPAWKACTLQDSDLAWIGLDSSKRKSPQMPIFVLQSSAEFAKLHLDTEDLNSVGQLLLSHAAQLLIPWLDTPDWFQVHRWRYAFPSHCLNKEYLDEKTSIPLICCGDWCGGNLIENAIVSGLAAAEKINDKLQQRNLPGGKFLEAI